jgi:hypothetical protein
MSVATAALWLRSYVLSDEWALSRATPLNASGENLLIVELQTRGGTLQLSSCRASIPDVPALYEYFSRPAPNVRFGWHLEHVSADAATWKREGLWERAGFQFRRPPPRAKELPSWWAVGVPFWVIVPVLVVLPLRKFVKYVVRWRRRRRGGCTACGYSLTGNTSGTCPECGSMIAGQEAMKA